MNLINAENMFPVPKNLLLLCVYRVLFGGAVTQCQPTGRSVARFLVTPVCMAKCL